MQAEGHIFVSISPSLLEKFEGYDELKAQQGIANYAIQLFRAISGNGDALLHIKWGKQADSATLFMINGKKALVPDVFAARLPFMDTTAYFIQYISRLLFINRTLFVNDTILEANISDFTHLSADVQWKFRRLANQFITFGYSISTLSQVVGKDMQGVPIHNLFEEAVKDHKAVGIFLTVHADMPSMYHEADGSSASEMLQLLCQGIYYQYGILLPAVSLRFNSELPLYQCMLQLNDLPLPVIKTIDSGYFVCNQPATDASLNFDHPVTSGHPNTAGMFSLRPIEIFEPGAYSSWGTWGVWVLQVSGIIRQYAGWFSNGFVFDALWDNTMKDHVMGQRVLEKYDKAFLTHVWRKLLQQGLFTRNLYRVMEGLLLARQSVLSDNNTIEFFHHPMVLSVDVQPAEMALQDPVYMAEGVRNYLRYELVASFGYPPTFWVLLLEPSFENALFGNEDYMALAPALLETLEFEIRYFQPNQVLHGILTVDAIRHKVEAMLGETYPFLKVMAYNELPADANIQPISRLTPELPDYEEE